MLYLWLDDERPKPSDGWAHVWDAEEAIGWLNMYGTPDMASLDHDLVEHHYPWNGVAHEDYTEPCGCDVIKYMIDSSIFPDRVIIHTQNPEGGAKMIELLQSCGYYWVGFTKVPGANPYSHVMER